MSEVGDGPRADESTVAIGRTGPWHPTVDVAELQAGGKAVVDVDGTEVLLLWFEDRVVALANRCIHRDRELSAGFLLKGRVVCPGHQWSFSLEDGFCKERDRSQPVHRARVADDGTVEVALVEATPA